MVAHRSINRCQGFVVYMLKDRLPMAWIHYHGWKSFRHYVTYEEVLLSRFIMYSHLTVGGGRQSPKQVG